MNIFPIKNGAVKIFAVPLRRDTTAAAVSPELPACLFIAVLIAMLCNGELTHDVAWQLSIADAILSGARLYIDIVELNPPLWFWMAIPVQELSSLIGVSANILLFVAIGLSAALSIIATSRLLPGYSKSVIAKLLLYAAALLMIMPGADFGQREQLALIAAIPWAALISLRANQVPIKPFFPILIAVFCACGFALKHYFVFPLIGLEFWLALSLRRRWTPFRPENFALACMAGAYVAAIFVVAPNFLSDIVPIIRNAYWGYQVPWQLLFIGVPQVIWLASLLLLLWAWLSRGGGLSSFEKALMISAIGFGAAFFVQGKGWPYHAIAVTGCLSLSVVSYLLRCWNSLSPVRRMQIEIIAALPLLFGCANLSYSNQYAPYFERAVSGLSSDSSVFVMAVDPMLASGRRQPGEPRHDQRPDAQIARRQRA